MYGRIALPDGDVVLHPFMTTVQSAALVEDLHKTIAWEQRAVKIGALTIPQPRLVSWLGDIPYTYSSLTLAPKPLTPMLRGWRDYLQDLLKIEFNSVLLNFYRDGRDSISPHSDDEPELGDDPTIASVSLGAERTMTFYRKDKTVKPVHIPLPDGSLLVMRGTTQHYWKHALLKTKNPDTGPRINLTFRYLHKP